MQRPIGRTENLVCSGIARLATSNGRSMQRSGGDVQAEGIDKSQQFPLSSAKEAQESRCRVPSRI